MYLCVCMYACMLVWIMYVCVHVYVRIYIYIYIYIYSLSRGHAIAQAVRRRPLTAEARVPARVIPCGICSGHVALGQISFQVLLFLLSTSFHRGSPRSYITTGMNNRPVGGRSSETVSSYRHEQHIDMY
jgi:hypothetical protein